MPDETATVEEWPVGGLGLLLVAAMAREVEYRRADGRNRIHLVLAAPLSLTGGLGLASSRV